MSESPGSTGSYIMWQQAQCGTSGDGGRHCYKI